MSEAMMIAVAAAIAGKTTEAVIQGGQVAVTSLVKLVKRRFASDPQAQRALDAAQTAPEENTDRLRRELERVAAADDEFGAELRRWSSTHLQLTGDKAAVNQINGPVANGAVVNQFGHTENVTFNL